MGSRTIPGTNKEAYSCDGCRGVFNIKSDPMWTVESDYNRKDYCIKCYFKKTKKDISDDEVKAHYIGGSMALNHPDRILNMLRQRVGMQMILRADGQYDVFFKIKDRLHSFVFDIYQRYIDFKNILIRELDSLQMVHPDGVTRTAWAIYEETVNPKKLPLPSILHADNPDSPYEMRQGQSDTKDPYNRAKQLVIAITLMGIACFLLGFLGAVLLTNGL